MKHYVYMIQHKDSAGRPVKIGVASDVERRLDELQVGNPYKLVIVAKIGKFSRKEAFAVESRLHERLKGFHIRGEWFRQDAVEIGLSHPCLKLKEKEITPNKRF